LAHNVSPQNATYATAATHGALRRLRFENEPASTYAAAASGTKSVT